MRPHLFAASAGSLMLALWPAPGQPAAAATPPACCAATGAAFPKVGGDLGNQNYSSLSQINTATVSRLGGAWHLRVENGDESAFQQSNPIAADGMVFVESTQGSLVAVDGATGEVKWRDKSGPNMLRRGAAVGEGKVFTIKGGNRVVALDSRTGARIWEKDLSGDAALGSMPTAVTYHDGLIYFGTANGKRGAAFALKAATGELAWKVYGAPRPGEFGNETWAGDSWKTGGASPWLHPAIDPELGLLYYAFGNARAGAPLDGATREGQNLFANSLVALDPKTGKRVWHFQSVHHDIWDMDNVMAPVLVDLKIGGRTRQAVIYGSKTAMLYILDRRTGEPIHPIDEKPTPQEPAQKTWPTQPMTRNQPLADLCPTGKGAGKVPPHYTPACLFTPHLDHPVVHFPGTGGGADTSAFSYSQKTGLLYVGVGVVGIAQARNSSYVGFRPLGEERSGKIVAYDPVKGRIAWEKPMEWSLAHGHGVLSTAGDVLFIGQPDGYLLALDAADGKELWRFQTGAGAHTSPITYEIGGVQYVSIFAGGNGLPYNSPKGDHLWAFRLGGAVPQAPAPPPPEKRQPITARPVPGAAVDHVFTLGRVWTNGAVGTEESNAQDAVAPQVLQVKRGAVVTFLNPPGNKTDRCATQFFEGLFDSKPLKPGQRFTYTFDKPGEYFFNDCASPGTTGKVIVE